MSKLPAMLIICAVFATRRVLLVAVVMVMSFFSVALADDVPAGSSTPATSPTPVGAAQSLGPFAISAGVAFSTSGNHQGIPSLGLQYSFATQPSGMAFVYLDLRSLVAYSAGAIGLGYSTESLTRERAYAGLGVGYSYAYVIGQGCGGGCAAPPCVDQCAPAGNDNGSGIGGKVFAGVPIASGLGIEADYSFSPQAGAIATNAIDLRLRYRFR